MSIASYISSGILESYCLGLLSEAEVRDVLLMGAIHKEVRDEITAIQQMLEKFATASAIAPAGSTKAKTFNAIYKSESGTGKIYPPFIEKGTSFNEIEAWINEQTLDEPKPDFGLAHIQPLPGDEYVTSFLAWITEGHPPETHTDYNEYIVVLRGSCTMLFNGQPQQYQQGDIITIPPHVEHQAIVTSKKPMLGMIQRQVF